MSLRKIAFVECTQRGVASSRSTPNRSSGFGWADEPASDLHLERCEFFEVALGLVPGVPAFNWPRLIFGAVAQLGERLICIQEVAGSIPTSSTSVGLGPVAQLARAHP